ncbi:hypothetical protein SDC9_158548 [bioreactor metagenome]|uniref:Uncharacterized protein n=1 Tax=bioreactor metagenome TaxID=1076179 RepID=A0A645FAG3_9ZZZZ
MIPAGKSLAGDRLSARSVKGFGVVSAISLDGRDLAESERMLLLHLTDLRAEGVRYLSLENKVILADAPRENEILGRRGVMEAELAIVAGPCRLYALDHSGTRLGEIPVRSTNGRLQVTLDTFAVPGNVVFAYELVRSL